jgi:hypothetical protein
MSKEELISGYVWLLKQLYSYENYATRAIGALKDYARHPNITWSLPKLSELKIVLRTFRYYFLTWDRKRRQFSWKILKYVFLHKPYTFYAAMSHLVGFKHFHQYVYEQLEKANSLRASVIEKLGGSVDSKAALLSQQAIAVYAELKKQATTLSKQAAGAREELQKQIAEVSQHASEAYEGIRQQTTAFISQATTAYEELGEQVTVMSRHAVAAYAELAQQAAILSQQIAAVNQQIAARYAELGRQAAAISQQAAMIADELEYKLMFIPQNQEISPD